MSTTEKWLEGAMTTDMAQGGIQHHASDAELKRSKDNTILSPQPSDDPKDPLVSSLSPKII